MILGLNGLYDLPELIHRLGASHEHLKDDYEMFLGNAFGTDQGKWPNASPARFDTAELAKRMQEGRVPRLLMPDQSMEDQLVPMNQTERFQKHLGNVRGIHVVRGQKCTGEHAAPWQEGIMIWDSMQDVLRYLGEEN